MKTKRSNKIRTIPGSPAGRPSTPPKKKATPKANSPANTPPVGTSAKRRPPARKSTRAGTRRPSALNAAAQVLAHAAKSMRCQDIVEAAAKKGLWKSKKGKTPAATIHAAMIREIKTKGSSSRFKKAGRGLFAVRGS